MTKKFEKGCAVDVRGMSDLIYDTLNRVCDFNFTEEPESEYRYLVQTIKNTYLMDELPKGYNLLTPTDILGEHLVKAIEGGYTPWFEGDDIPESCLARVDNGFTYNITSKSLIWENKKEHIIAYKPIEQPSIQATVLSEKVGPTSFLLLSEQSHNDLLNIKASAESIKKSDCEIAKALMREVFKELSDELDNKEGE